MKKTVNRILIVALAVAMMLGTMSTAFAAGWNTGIGSGSIGETPV